MEDTLASIRPPNDDSMDARLSFLDGRDPSIVAYGQVRIPAADTKKNLESLFEDEELESRILSSSAPSLSVLGDTVKVYLRLRPFPVKMRPTKQQQEAYEIINSTTLLTRLPRLDSNTSSLKRSKESETVLRKFTFTQTFGPEITQLQLFDMGIKQQMNEFLAGRNSTVMSYGTTNAGKSFTLQGTTVSPGIIPRALEFVFNQINPRSTPYYKPVYNTDVVSLDANERAQEMELKTKLLSFGSIDKNQYIQAYRAMQQQLQDESPLKPNETSDANYAIWVSFAEIYNETIFDLLSNDCQKKRPPLKLATDSSGKAFIKGLKTVCVNSASEAYQLLMAGQYNLKVAATALNTRSSRSHCVFTIKVLKYHKENSPADVEVSSFSFCDLAGSERLKKTLNEGERLKEAQNINTSLLVLGRCLKSIFEVQTSKSKQDIIGPFRESKLTRLFQSALSGKEHIALIVNVNPVPNLYVETQNVLNFSAIAKQIVIEPVIRVKRRVSTSRFSQMVSQSIKTVTDWDVTELESIVVDEDQSSAISEKAEYVHAEDYEEMVIENEKLKQEIVKLKNSALDADFAIRQEMSNIYSDMIKDIERNFKNQLQDVEERQEDMLEWSVQQVESYYKKKLEKLSSRKRTRVESEDDTDEEIDVKELEDENVQLKAKVQSLKTTIKDLRESKDKLFAQNNENAFELSLAKKDLENCKNLLYAAQNNIGCDDKAKGVIEELKKQLSAREDQIKSLKEYLNEAKVEWLRSTDVESKLEEALKNKDKELLESSEKIDDLMEQLEHTNVCLAERTQTVETLEDKLERYAKKLADAEEEIQNADDKWNKCSANYLVLLKEKEELQKSLDEEIARSKTNVIYNTGEEQVLELERLNKDLSRDVRELKDQIKIKNDTLDELNSKLLDSESENLSLKNRLGQSSNHTKMLREELNSTKATLSDITEQINSLKLAEAAKVDTANVDSQTSFVSDCEKTEKEITVHIKQEKFDDHPDVQTNDKEDNEQDSDLPSSKETPSISHTEENNDTAREKLEQLMIEYNELKTQCLYETLRVEELNKELDEVRQELSSLKITVEVNEQELKECKNSLKSVANKLQLTDTELTKAKNELEERIREKESLEIQFSECKVTVEKLQNDLSDSERQNRDKSETLAEYNNRLNKQEKDIATAKERDLIKEQLLDAHFQRISKLEKDLEQVAILERNIVEIKGQLKTCEEEKAELKKQLSENCQKMLLLEKDLQASISREQDKENETISLQKEMKSMIQMNSSINKRDADMENEVKNALRKLTATEAALDESQAAYKRLEESSQEKMTEVMKKFEEKEREMESFKKNRNDAMQRYEALVKQLQENAKREKREKYQELFSRQSTPTPYKDEIRKLKDELRSKTSLLEQMQANLKNTDSKNDEKENIVNTSEDEATAFEVRSTRRRGRKNAPTNADDISVIDLSGSESKRVTRRTALQPPSPVQSVEKRKTRKKKLFAQADDNCVDIEPTESTPRPILRSPLSATRSLRNRRK
ncbi:kinesin-like protein KIF20A isoform X2 [Diprion similis]|uniref:kinesin-like protein KIF20A isoform X2 n=1 Tax=Diprion similis TaxID=362088 RepID=UPI001EF819BA|nr:kinesin-like protein KIF20A isoform X2 [Diprion similis]